MLYNTFKVVSIDNMGKFLGLLCSRIVPNVPSKEEPVEVQRARLYMYASYFTLIVQLFVVE